MRTDSNFSCFLDTIIYKEKNHFYHSEKTGSFSCVFSGSLKVGPLRFNTTQVNLKMGEQVGSNNKFRNSLQLAGTFSESTDFTFGIFKHHPDSCMNVQFLFAQKIPGYTGSFCAICNMFGIEKLADVRITREIIKFQVRGKMYKRFVASMNCSSHILPWENQEFNVDGKFERSAGEIDFVTTVTKELESYAKSSISQAMRRKEAVDQTVKRAHVRLEKVLLLKKIALSELQRLTDDYMLAKKHYETAQKKMKLLEIGAKEYSRDIEDLKLYLDNLCNIKQCDEVCQEGIYCTTCYNYITENPKGVCPETCFRTKQRRIPPYFTLVSCKRERCKRIHSTNELFKRTLGNTIEGLVKSVLSFATTGVSTAFGGLPPVAGAIGKGITTLLDTGKADKLASSLFNGIFVGDVGAKGLISVHNKAAATLSKHLTRDMTRISFERKLAKAVSCKAISCQRRQKDGHWNCEDIHVKCKKGTYQYEYKHYPYECKKSCVTETTTRAIERSCCKSVSCASLVTNITCVVENAVCKKARVDALQRTKSTLEAKKILQNFEYTRSNVSYWSIKMQKRHRSVLRQQSLVNQTLRSAHSHEKAYNSTIESQTKLKKLLSKPLKIISLFNQQSTSNDRIKLKEIYFKTKVYPGNDNTLLPIVVTFEVSGTLRQLSTVFDFTQVSTSLKRVSEEILVDISTHLFSSSKKKRSIDTLVSETDTLLFTLKTYHNYCAKFTNYHEILYNVAQSLYNLATEHSHIQSALTQSDYLADNFTNLISSSKFALGNVNYSHVDYFKNDTELSEALKFRQEEMRQNYESLDFTGKLLMYNWFATTEDMFRSSRMNYECSGMRDCLIYILDSLVQMFSVIEADGADHILKQVEKLEIQLDYLSNSTNTTVEEGLKISSQILIILEKMTEVDVLCAQSPNITKQPEPITELDIGRVLVLNCKAFGTALSYSWTFNGKVIEDQKTNVLTINNVTLSNSGNYTCIVSNHIAKEKSTPAVVVVHPPPIITEQPVEYLAAVLAGDDYLQCLVEETSNNVSYQWWFRPANSTASFLLLSNETFSYINFSPMTTKDEGWYFCQVSNTYGETMSHISFVKALSFTLPVPTAVLSFFLDSQTHIINSSGQPFNFTSYGVFSSYIIKHILSRSNFSTAIHVEDLRPINCLFGKTKNECNISPWICSWQFQYVGRNVTSNVTIDNDFEANAGMVISATQELSETIERFVNATNNGSLSFLLVDVVYFSKWNSISIHKYSLICPRNQVLLQKELKCGKINRCNLEI